MCNMNKINRMISKYNYTSREQFQNQIYRHSLRRCIGRSKRELHAYYGGR